MEVGKEAGVGAKETVRTVMLWEGDTVGLLVEKAHMPEEDRYIVTPSPPCINKISCQSGSKLWCL